MAASSAEFRPYRNGVMIVWLVFTLTFIGLVTRSVFRDLYGAGASRGPETGRMTIAACTDELESLNRDLQVHTGVPPLARSAAQRDRFDAEWDVFTSRFEDRLRHVQADCVDQVPEGAADEPVRAAMAASVDGLDSLRQHMARCGLEGEREQEAVTSAIGQLHDAALNLHKSP